MIARWNNTFIDLNRIVRAEQDGNKMSITLASPAGNVVQGLYMTPDEFEDMVSAHIEVFTYTEPVDEKPAFSTPADWANVGRAGSEGSM